MRLRYARLSTLGPVRPVNEDWLDFWESPDPLTREKQGSVALLADGHRKTLGGALSLRTARGGRGEHRAQNASRHRSP